MTYLAALLAIFGAGLLFWGMLSPDPGDDPWIDDPDDEDEDDIEGEWIA
jgi:hypothetical protein